MSTFASPGIICSLRIIRLLSNETMLLGRGYAIKTFVYSSSYCKSSWLR